MKNTALQSCAEGNGGISKLDESCISNPEIRNCKLDGCPRCYSRSNLRFLISGFEMQDSSNFEIFSSPTYDGLNDSLAGKRVLTRLWCEANIASSTRFDTPSLSKILVRWCFTVSSLI